MLPYSENYTNDVEDSRFLRKKLLTILETLRRNEMFINAVPIHEVVWWLFNSALRFDCLFVIFARKKHAVIVHQLWTHCKRPQVNIERGLFGRKYVWKRSHSKLLVAESAQSHLPVTYTKAWSVEERMVLNSVEIEKIKLIWFQIWQKMENHCSSLLRSGSDSRPRA